jgi:hypothetical protein
MECAAGHSDALQRLRMRSFGVVVTSPFGRWHLDELIYSDIGNEVLLIKYVE